jgi:hypothetical protein
MDERDKRFVEGMRSRGDEDKAIYNLLGIVDDLDKQLTAIKDAGKPFRIFVSNMESNIEDTWMLCETRLWRQPQKTLLLAGQIRRLAEALKGVEE